MDPAAGGRLVSEDEVVYERLFGGTGTGDSTPYETGVVMSDDVVADLKLPGRAAAEYSAAMECCSILYDPVVQYCRVGFKAVNATPLTCSPIRDRKTVENRV